MTARKILYVDLDNTLVDFQSGIDRIDPVLDRAVEKHVRMARQNRLGT